MVSVADLLSAALTGRYAIHRELDSRGKATVFLADDLRHRRRVAIRVLHPELAAALGHERLLREIEIAAGLSHAHILPLYDSGNGDSHACRSTAVIWDSIRKLIKWWPRLESNQWHAV